MGKIKKTTQNVQKGKWSRKWETTEQQRTMISRLCFNVSMTKNSNRKAFVSRKYSAIHNPRKMAESKWEGWESDNRLNTIGGNSFDSTFSSLKSTYLVEENQKPPPRFQTKLSPFFAPNLLLAKFIEAKFFYRFIQKVSRTKSI